jgi:hypothetical protein
LPETGEQEEEQAELSEQEGGPDSRLGEHVHGGAGGEDDGCCSEESEKEEDRPRLREVGAEGSPGRAEGAADAAIWLSVTAEVQAELDCVDLDEIKVETEDGGDQEDDDVTDEGCEECVASDSVVVDVVGPFFLKEEEGAEDECGDDEREEGDADEAPEVEQALMEKHAEASGTFGLVAEEGSRNEEEVDQKIEGNGGVVASPAAAGTLLKAPDRFGDGAEVEAAYEALSREGVIHHGAQLTVETDGEEQGETKIEGVGPENSREAAEGEPQAVEKDVAVFGHA